jgi:UPF0716 family protein affecting phage T7 exclusion
MAAVTLFGPIDTLLGAEIGDVLVIELLLLGLAVGNLLARQRAHQTHRQQATEGADAIERHPLHVATNVGLVVGSLYYLTVLPHPGMVLSVLVVGLIITDLFEFEARKVEARRDLALSKPKAAIGASLLVVSYVAYVSLFFIIKPLWNAVI